MRTIPRLSRVSASIALPASRDETLRALMLAAVSPGETRITGALDMDDTRYVVETIRRLGYEVSGTFPTELVIGERVSIYATEVEIDVADAETAFRWLLPFLSFTPGRTILRLSRPLEVSPVVGSLRALDAEIEYIGTEGQPPLGIRGKIVRGGFAFASDDEIAREAMRIMALGFRDGLLIDGERVSTAPAPPRIEIGADPFLVSCWQSITARVGGEIIINGERFSSEGAEEIAVRPRTLLETEAWEAIGGLAGGESVIENETALARAYPRFWRVFDEVVANSESR